jgi:hypothetical protein
VILKEGFEEVSYSVKAVSFIFMAGNLSLRKSSGSLEEL